MADSTNGYSDGTQFNGLSVGSVYLDQYKERNNPLSSVQSSKNGNEPATKADVDRIISQVKSGYENYNNLQRSYIDAQRKEQQSSGTETSSDGSSSSETETVQSETKTPSTAENEANTQSSKETESKSSSILDLGFEEDDSNEEFSDKLDNAFDRVIDFINGDDSKKSEKSSEKDLTFQTKHDIIDHNNSNINNPDVVKPGSDITSDSTISGQVTENSLVSSKLSSSSESDDSVKVSTNFNKQNSEEPVKAETKSSDKNDDSKNDNNKKHIITTSGDNKKSEPNKKDSNNISNITIVNPTNVKINSDEIKKGSVTVGSNENISPSTNTPSLSGFKSESDLESEEQKPTYKFNENDTSERAKKADSDYIDSQFDSIIDILNKFDGKGLNESQIADSLTKSIDGLKNGNTIQSNSQNTRISTSTTNVSSTSNTVSSDSHDVTSSSSTTNNEKIVSSGKTETISVFGNEGKNGNGRTESSSDSEKGVSSIVNPNSSSSTVSAPDRTRTVSDNVRASSHDESSDNGNENSEDEESENGTSRTNELLEDIMNAIKDGNESNIENFNELKQMINRKPTETVTEVQNTTEAKSGFDIERIG